MQMIDVQCYSIQLHSIGISSTDCLDLVWCLYNDLW